MLLEQIYDKVYAETDEIRKGDHEISNQLMPLIESADLEVITREEFVELVCRACAVGEREGFASGARFLAKLVCEALS